MRTPCTRSIVSTRSLVNSQCTCGTRMFLPSGERVQMRDPGVHRLRLEPEVQLLGQIVGEVGDHVLRGQPPAQLGQFDGLGEPLQDLQVGGHPAPDARSLNLDDDLLAGVQGGVMHLGDRRRGERLFLELGEQARTGSSPSSSLSSLCTSSVSAGGTRSSRLRNSRDSDSPNAPGLEAMIWPNLTYVGPRSAKVCGISLMTLSWNSGPGPAAW